MSRKPLVSLGVSLLLWAAGCGTAWADRPVLQPIAAPGPAPSPFTVELIRPNGSHLPTFAHNGRTYLLGDVGDRYAVRVRNPTGHRVEAVISVDGLDVIDGQSADFVHKRGYIVPAYGELVVDGWRVSTADVAAFRFSSVRRSYAGRKRQARNVGVVGVAIFTERVREPVYIPVPERYPVDRPAPRDWRGGMNRQKAPAGARAHATPPPPAATGDTAGSAAPQKAEAESRASAPTAPVRDRAYGVGGGERCCAERPVPTHRPGLGTEFGERRYSPATYTRFERSNATRPAAIMEIRYNDRAGLVALGIPLQPVDPVWDTELRETANPFPGYAQPPTDWR